MKRIIILILALSLLTGCAAVREPEAEETSYTCGELAAAIIAGQSGLPELYAVTYGEPEFSAYSLIYLGDLADDVTDGVICYPLGPQASEVAVFGFSSGVKALLAQEALRSYISSRAAAFFGYAPEESALAEAGAVLSGDGFVALAICHDPDGARSSFSDCFGQDAPEPPDLFDYVSRPPASSVQEPDPEPDPEPVPEPTPGITDEYDHDAVLAAFRSGDTSSLTPKNLEVYRRCLEILDEVIRSGMTDVEKELAINDYLVYNIEYDPYALQDKPGLIYEPDCDNPYGALVKGYGICLGYATSFQLLMDMVGIRCITVRGYSKEHQEDHAWNEVELDGQWYCVDVTWNDPLFIDWTPTDSERLFYARSFFNVTSDYMRSTDHQWDDSDVPEATGTRYAFR